MNYNLVSATIGIRAVDPRKLADDNSLKRMVRFNQICKQIDAKHDHVMEMLADIQEQLRNLEMKQRKETGVNLCVRDAQSQSQMEAIKPSLLPPYITSEIDAHEEAETIVVAAEETMVLDEQKVFDEIPKSENSKTNVISPLVRGSEIAEVYDFGVSNSQFQMPLVSTLEIKMELEGFSPISTRSLFSPSSNGTKLEGEGSAEVPIYTTVAELQPHESEYGFEVLPKLALIASKSIVSTGKVEALSWPLIVPKVVEDISVLENPKMMDNHSIHYILCRDVRSRDLGQWQENSPNLSIRELIPSGRIIVSSLLHSPFLYNCYNGDGLTKEELKWLDTGQYLVVRDFSRDGVTFDLIVCWNLMNEMCWDKNILVSGMQLKDSWSEWGEIKIVVRGANSCEQNSGALRIHELVDCVSLYMMNFTCLAFAYDPGIYCMCWNESLVHFLKIQLDNSATSNHKIGMYGVKMMNNVSIFHKSLVNPTVGLEDVIPLQEINSLHTAEWDQVDQDQVLALKKFGLAKFHSTANGFGNDPLHCFKVYFKPNKLLLNCEINGGVGRFRKTIGHYKEKKNLEATLVFDPGDLDFFSLNIEDNSVEVVIFGGISIAFSSWYIVSGFYFYYQGSESNHYNYHSLGDVNVQQNCVAAFVGEAVEFEVVSIEVVTWGKKVGGSECPKNQRNENGGLIASLWALKRNFELILLEFEVVTTVTKAVLELDRSYKRKSKNAS